MIRRSPIRRTKYNAKRVRGELRSFDSQAEARRAAELVLLEKAGEISDLRYQVTVPLFGKNGTRVCAWRADFVYRVKGDKRDTFEDVKGFRTDLFALKAKLFRDNYGFPIYETSARRGR